MASQEDPTPQTTVTGSARAGLTRMWSSLRSINVDGDDNVEYARNTMLGKWTPRSSSMSDENKEGAAGALENVVRSMFGSCVALGEDEDEPRLVQTVPDRRRELLSKSRSKRRGSSSTGVRAQQAVYNLLEKAEQRETSPSQRKPSRTSPRKQIKHEVPYLVHEVGPPPPPPNAPHLANNATFDDGISAISAHTLEELDRQHKLRKPHRFNTVQSDLTQEQSFETSINKSHESAEERDLMTSPIDMTRERSNTTWGTKGTRGTYRSTSTESTDFEQVWRQEEQKYWQEAVEKDQEKRSKPAMRRGGSERTLRVSNSRDFHVRSRSRELEMMIKQDGTNTTAGSSAFSGRSSRQSSPAHSHPHDAMPLDLSDFVPVSARSPRKTLHDPDRIQEFLAIDAHTEIGEI